jgi:hypothetical protein
VRIPACLRFWYVWKYGVYAGEPRFISSVLTPDCMHVWCALLPAHTTHTHTHTQTHTHSTDPKAGYGKGKYGWTKWDVCVPQASMPKSLFSFFFFVGIFASCRRGILLSHFPVTLYSRYIRALTLQFFFCVENWCVAMPHPVDVMVFFFP